MLPASQPPELGQAGRHPGPHFLTWGAGMILPSSGACPGDSEPSWAHSEDLSQAHRPFWESFPVRPGLAFFLGTLQGVRWTPKATALSPLYVEEAGLGALPTRGLSKLLGEKIFLLFWE